jgi:hypothetical protein
MSVCFPHFVGLSGWCWYDADVICLDESGKLFPGGDKASKHTLLFQIKCLLFCESLAKVSFALKGNAAHFFVSSSSFMHGCQVVLFGSCLADGLAHFGWLSEVLIQSAEKQWTIMVLLGCIDCCNHVCISTPRTAIFALV